MKILITEPKEYDVKTLVVEAGVRYWEDATIDGVEDENGDLIPCRKGDLWNPIIDIDKGIIKNWEAGKTAEIHYKVCDAGTYRLLDVKDTVIVSIENNYVPQVLCPGDNGYGDYIIMDIDANGLINNWNPSFNEFFNRED